MQPHNITEPGNAVLLMHIQIQFIKKMQYYFLSAIDEVKQVKIMFKIDPTNLYEL